MTASIKIAGKSDLWLGLPGSQSTLVYLGEQRDETPIETQGFYHDVHGDSHGGPNGPPIERQILGQIMRVQFSLSKWDHVLRAAIEQHSVFATHGTIADSEIGALLFKENSFRLLVKNSRDNTPSGGSFDPFTFNFPCALLSSPISAGQGTKHSILNFSMEAHRVPAGHESTKTGVLFDRDVTGIPV